jgi:hypothetical protein
MSIVFFCQSCGARFEVAPQSAGKRGRCKTCGQITEIPRAEQLASMVAMPAMAHAPIAAAPPRPAAPAAVAAPAQAAPASVSSWLKSAASSIGLAPLTASALPLAVRDRTKPSPLDDADDSKPYRLAGPEPHFGHGSAVGAAGAALMVWRREVGVVQRIFRWLNESAYLVSVPFIGIFLFGAATKSRGLALFGATFVVLLNIGRIVAGIANLVVVPLRSGLQTSKLKRPFRRVVEPIVTIAIVFLAFTFIPWLAPKTATQGTIAERVRGGAKSLEGEIKGELESTVDKAKHVDLEKLGAEARERLRTIGIGEGAAPATGRKQLSAEEAVEGLIKDVRQRARSTVEESQKQP